MVFTLLCAAMTIVLFIVGQVSEGHWKWGEPDGPQYTSAVQTGKDGTQYISSVRTGKDGTWYVSAVQKNGK